MKITIDTKEDSHEEIKKVIRLLNHLIEGGGDIFSNSPGSSDSGSSGGAFANMFGGGSTPAPEKSETAQKMKEEVTIIDY